MILSDLETVWGIPIISFKEYARSIDYILLYFIYLIFY